MGAKEIREQLDSEIAGLEDMIYGSQSPAAPGEPAEPNADGQPAPGSQKEVADGNPRPAIGTEPQSQSEKNFDLQQQSQDSNGNDDDNDQEEPTTQKRVSWKQRFIKLKQYHDSERYKDRTLVGQLYDQIASYEAEVGRLNALVDDLSKAVKPQSIKDYATQEEIDAIGEEELTTMDRLTSQAVERSTADLKKRLAAAEERDRKARESAASTARGEAYKIFLSRLETLVPDYAEVDVDKRFDAWLEMIDPPSGFKRKELFKQAERTGDVGRVAGFFNEFKVLVGSGKTLDRKVTPVGSSNAGPMKNNNNGQPEVVSMASYEQFMNDVTRGRFKGREADAKKWEQYFDKALAEGRLR